MIPHIILRFVWGSIWKPFGMVFGSTFGALGGQKVAKMSSKIGAKICIEKIASEEAQLPEAIPSWWQEGVRGEVPPPPGVRRLRRMEEKKKRRKEEGKKEERKVGSKAGRFYTLVLVGRRIVCQILIFVAFFMVVFIICHFYV